MERANYEFSADLAKIDTSFVEQLLLDLVKRFKDKFIPPMGHNAAFNMPKYLHGLLSEGAKTVHGIYLYAEHASFSPGEQFENAPKIGRFLARGEFENWKPQRGRHAKITIETPLEPLAHSGATGTAEVAVTTSTLPKSVTLIEKEARSEVVQSRSLAAELLLTSPINPIPTTIPEWAKEQKSHVPELKEVSALRADGEAHSSVQKSEQRSARVWGRSALLREA